MNASHVRHVPGGRRRAIPHLQVPPITALIGTTFTFQGYDEPNAVTRPVSFALGV